MEYPHHEEKQDNRGNKYPQYHDDDDGDDDMYTTGTAPRRSRRWMWVGIVALLIAAIVVVLAIALVGGGGNNNPHSPSGTTVEDVGNKDHKNDDTDSSVPLYGSPLENFARAESRSNGIEFDNDTSYQLKALAWAHAHQDYASDNNPLAAEDRQIQRFALACLYYATYQVPNQYTDLVFGETYTLPPWNDEARWMSNHNECSWHGVECNNDDGRVTSLILSKNALSGTFPHEIRYLGDSLQILHLSTNFFHNAGDDGHDFLPYLSGLRNFSARDTYFQYEGFPWQFGALPELEVLDVSYVVYHGATDANFLDRADTNSAEKPLSKLLFLDVSGNSFQSTIPRSLVTSPNLVAFYSVNSDVVEDNLDWLLDMTSAVEVWVDENPAISGRLPHQIDAMSQLQSFAVTECALSGPLPAALGSMSQLQQVWLYDNALTGPIPAALGQLSALRILELQDNQLQGIMPEMVCDRATRGLLQGGLRADCPDLVECSCCACCGTNQKRECSGRDDSKYGGGRLLQAGRANSGRRRMVEPTTAQSRPKRKVWLDMHGNK